MAGIKELFASELKVVNAGAKIFSDSLAAQGVGVVDLDWQPPAGGDVRLLEALDSLEDREEIEAANQEAVERIAAARPVLVDLQAAGRVVPGMTGRTILHAGPPVTWERMCGPMRGAVTGALLYEGWARDEVEAASLAASGEITFSPCHEHQAVGPMAGIISPSMPVFVIENVTHGNRAFCTMNEGLGKVLRYGAYSPDVISKLKWMETVLAPALREAIQLSGGIDLRALIAQALHMGDECHNRNKAATSLFIRTLAPYLVRTATPPGTLAQVFGFMDGNDHFFLNLSMPACKAIMDAAHGIPHSTVVTTMARNGTDFGIRVSGLGDRWFTAPAGVVDGLYFPGYTAADANPDIGDSAITETTGIGGFAMAGAVAIVQFVGGTVADAGRYTKLMYEITLAESRTFTIPQLNFRGTPTAIDLRKVLSTGVLPHINTGIAHKDAGVGQVGAGLVHPPRACFEKALLAMAEA